MAMVSVVGTVAEGLCVTVGCDGAGISGVACGGLGRGVGWGFGRDACGGCGLGLTTGVLAPAFPGSSVCGTPEPD